MNIFEYFNTAVGACIIIILIMIDYLRKYNTDNFQRKLLIIMLSATLAAAITDFIGLSLERNPELYFLLFNKSELPVKSQIILKIIWTIYLVSRNCCYYYGAVFVDYFAHGNIARTKKFLIIVTVFIALYIISIIPNFKQGYYFYISRDNTYMQGSLYMLQLFISYLPIFLILINISLTPKYIKRNQVLLIMFFVIISAIGAAIDIILRTTNLIWPCIAAAVLYMYFFILRSDSKIDSLTGVGNRNNFYEYINVLSKQETEKSYAFIKIDLNHLGDINSNFGNIEGDNALRDLSAIIKGCIRHTDFAVRYGGDEFILITPAESDIQRIIDRIIEEIDFQNQRDIRPYQLRINYTYDVYTTNSRLSIQDFLSYLDTKMQKNKPLL